MLNSLFRRNPKAVSSSDASNGRARVSAARTKGDKARDAGRWREAGDAYHAHLAEYPNDFAIWVQLGHARKQAGDLAAADAAYGAANQLEPGNSDLLLSFGHLAKMRGDLERAAGFYQASYDASGNEHALVELSQPQMADAVAKLVGNLARGQVGPVISPVLRTSPAGAIDVDGGWVVNGWAVDQDDDTRPAEVAIFVDGELARTVVADRFRGDIAKLGLGSSRSGFETTLDLDFSEGQSYEIAARLAKTGQELGNSPITMQAPAPLRRWLTRKASMGKDASALIRAYAAREAVGRMSIVMPVYNTRPEWLREALNSVRDQWYDDWELICVDDFSPNSEVREILSEFAERDVRIRPIFLEQNVGIATATNRAIDVATGDMIGFMDHDDYLEPDAVYRMLAASKSGAELLYSDEAVTSESIHTILHVAARPAFSHDYYLSHPYFVHFVCVKTELARAIGGLDETMPISADVDFVLRAIENAKFVTHVPSVLYRWRTHESSAGHQKKEQVTEATLGALNRHLQRFGIDGHATPGLVYNTHRIEFYDKPAPTLIVIPTKNGYNLLRACIESVQSTTKGQNVDILVIDHQSDDPETRRYLAEIADQVTIVPFAGPFNYAKMNNFAVANADSKYEYITFLNNDIEAIEVGWLQRLRSLCRRKDVGVAGATLLYGARTIQHSGVVLGLGDLVDHANKFLPFEVAGKRNIGYNATLIATRNYTAVTGACMMMRRSVFEEVGGFDEELAIGYNDTDLCLRVGAAGYHVLNDPFAVLYHHESMTREKTNQISHPEDGKLFSARWNDILLAGDPFYNPLLVHRPAIDHSIGTLDNWYWPPRTRAVRL